MDGILGNISRVGSNFGGDPNQQRPGSKSRTNRAQAARGAPASTVTAVELLSNPGSSVGGHHFNAPDVEAVLASGLKHGVRWRLKKTHWDARRPN